MNWGNPIRLICFFAFIGCLHLTENGIAQSLIIRETGSSDLSNTPINDIVQDQFGYLWLGTDKGLFKFDGLDFQKVDLHTEKNPIDITALFIDRSNHLWIGRSGGVTCFDGSTFKEFNFGGDTIPAISTIRQDKVGAIWFVSSENNLYKEEKNGEISLYDKFSDLDVSAIGSNSSGDILMATLEGHVSAHLEDQLTNICELNNGHKIKCIYSSRSEGLLIGTENGLYRFNKSDSYIDPEMICASENVSVNQISETIIGEIWIGGETGLYRLSGNCLEKIDKQQGFATTQVSTVYGDREGNLWIGTRNKGLYRYHGEYFRFFNRGVNASNKIAKTINMDEEGNLWIGYFSGEGLEIFSGNRIEKYNRANGFISDYVRSSYYDPEGAMWIVTTRGVARFNSSGIDYLTTQQGLPNNYGYHVTKDVEENIWIATLGGLSSFRDGIITNYTMANGLSGNRVEYIHPLSQGGVLVSSEGGIDVLENGRIEQIISVQELKGSLVGFIVEDKEGAIWLGTNDQTIFKLDLGIKKLSTLKNITIPDKITFLTFDKKERFIIGTQNAILVTRIEGDRVVEKALYGSEYGLFVSEINEGAYYLDDNNKLWFGTENGVFIFDPDEKRPKNTYPIVAVTSINVPDQHYDWIHRSDSLDTWYGVPMAFTIPYGQNDFIFRFKGISLNRSEEGFYRCFLEGYETNWTKPFSDDFVAYNNLKPGKYRFTVQGSFDGENWAGPGTTIQFQIIPPFWKTIWFYMLIVSIMLLLFILYNNYRISVRMQQFIEIEEARVLEAEKTRKKVAMDFHDEVGNQLTGISVLAQLIRKKSKDLPSDMKVLVDKIDFESKKLFQGTNDFIWSIDPNNDNFREVYLNIRDYGDDLFDNSSILFHTQNGDMDSLNMKLPAGFSRQMVLVFKEGLQNTLNHAGCKNVYLSVFASSGSIEIKLVDDGMGFESEKLNYKEGLKKMEQRSNKLRSELIVNSIINEGTEIILKVIFPEGTMNQK